MSGWVSNGDGTSTFLTSYGPITLPDSRLDNSWLGDDLSDITTQSAGYHEYHVETNLGLSTDDVTLRQVQDALNEYPTPFGPYFAGPGFVSHYSPNKNTVTNITTDFHILDPGVVVRKIIVEDGEYKIKTFGMGTGIAPEANESLAPAVWGAADANIAVELIEGSGFKAIPEGFNTTAPECFPAGTLITLADGSQKPIEDIRHGEYILSPDEHGNLVRAIVDKLYTNTTDAFIRLSFDDERNDLIATPGHHFLTETGDFLEIGHMAHLGGGTVRIIDTDGSTVTAKAERITYCAETAEMFEEAEDQTIISAGNTILKEECPPGWKTYNFEVRDTHTYIAGGIRVHNLSVLNYLSPIERANIVDYEIENGRISDAVVKYPDSNTEVHTRLVNRDGTQQVLREATFSDGKGNLYYQRSFEDAQGNVVTKKPVALDGQQNGGDFAKSLTPFVTLSLIGEDGSAFEEVAADTVIGTVLENLGQVIGGTIHRNAVNVDDFHLSTQIDTAMEVSFENFGGELVINGAEAATSVVNQLIIGEIFESISLDGSVGHIFEDVTSQGLNKILLNGAKDFIGSEFFIDVLQDTGLSPESIRTISDWAGSQAQFDPLNALMGAIITEVLPDIDTEEGAIASAVTNAAIALFEGLSAALGPAAPVVGWVVGKLFDELFEKHPQAWTNVGFDSDTGRFVITGTWSDDGGNTEISRELAQAYIDGMNGFVDTVKSNSNNYSDLAKWSFGHYEENLKIAGKNSQSFGDFQKAYMTSYVKDLEKVQLNDGQYTAVRALKGIDLTGKESEYNKWAWLHILNEMYETKSLPDLGAAYEVYSADHVYNVLDGSILGVGIFSTIEVAVDGKHDPYGNPSSADVKKFIDIKNISSFRELVQVHVDHALRNYDPDSDPNSGTLPPTPEKILYQYLQDASWTSLEDLMEVLGGPDRVYNVEDRYQLINSNLQIASDYHKYLENQDAIDAMIRLDPNTAFAAGWVATLAAAKDLGLDKPYKLTGDGIGNNFFTAAGDDIVRGKGGKDDIRTYEGEDTLIGGSGADKLDGGRGLDRVSYEGSGARVVIDLQAGSAGGGHAKGDKLLSIEQVVGSDHNDILKGTHADNVLIGAAGHDSLYGRGGEDDLYGRDGNDRIDGGYGNDRLWGGAGNDTLIGGSGADTLRGGSGTDLLSYANSTEGVLVRLYNNTAQGGLAEGDDISGFENVVGGSGHDTLAGNSSANGLFGRGGNDVLEGNGGGNTLNGGGGNDKVTYADAGAAVTADLEHAARNTGIAKGDSYVSIEWLTGSNFNDDLAGTNGANTIWGKDGDDFLNGRSGDDLLYGGNGNDKFHGGAGHDKILGEAGNDTIWAHEGNDTLIGGDGKDVLYASSGNDDLRGGNHDDKLLGETGRDTLSGDDGNDTLDGGDHDDLLKGGHGDDVLHGGSGDDELRGQQGNDTLYGGSGADYFQGGGGRDEVSYYDASARVIVDLQDSSKNAGAANGDRFSAVENIFGSDHNDVLRGDKTDNVFWGGHGSDKLDGRSGDDELYAGTGNDILIGGGGNDRMIGADGNDRFRGDAGKDTLKGGAGDDVFIFTKHGDQDRIKDFQNDIDTIEIRGLGIGNFAQARDLATQKGDDVFFEFGDGDRLIVEDTRIAALQDDMIFTG